MEVVEDLEGSCIIVIFKEDLKELFEGCYKAFTLKPGVKIEMRRVV